MQRNSVCCNSVVATYFPHAYHYCQEPCRLYLLHLSYSIGSQVFQPCSAPWYLPKICSRISQACLCISASKSLRWSRYIAMMSRWFALKRTSSSNGKSHSKRTIRVCTSLKTLVTLSKPIIQPMSWSSTASRNGRVLRRLSILSTDSMAILFLNLNASVPITIQWFLNSLHSQTSRPVVGVLIVQTPHLCLQDLLPTSAYQSYLLFLAYLQASCRSLHCPNTSLVSPGLTPNLSLSRYSHSFRKHVISGTQLTSHLQQMTLQPTCTKMKQRHTVWIKNTQVLRCPWLYNSSIPT